MLQSSKGVEIERIEGCNDWELNNAQLSKNYCGVKTLTIKKTKKKKRKKEKQRDGEKKVLADTYFTKCREMTFIVSLLFFLYIHFHYSLFSTLYYDLCNYVFLVFHTSWQLFTYLLPSIKDK